MIFWWLIGLIAIVLIIPFFRRAILVRPVYKSVRKQKSRISEMEKQALTAGRAGFEKSLFTGRPDWKALRALPALKLTQEEEAVINGPVEELCKITDDWEIRYKLRRIPDHLWNFMMKNKLFGLRVPKERGGHSLSFQAQSLILGKVASRSIDVATMIELPTSLWPDEIVEKYGTHKQKEYYMPRFAESKEIVSFAITGISNGSDATSMRDVGEVEYGIYEGKEVLGVRLNIQKRYITFAPKATLLVLGFQMKDPQNHLGKGVDVGISLALIPANHPGINIGRRHLPTNVAFPNGPIWGKDVFIPIEWLLGGPERAGEGWRMIMECLFVGRAIALPAISVAAAKLSLRTAALYARIRRQFGSPIGTFEGIEEPLTRLVETAYVMESLRSLSTSMVDVGDRPLSISSLMKYRTTEYARQAVNDAMDIHAGRAIMDGPSNYLMSSFLAAPIGVTVEGANIVTRSIITFAQGVLQTHPYLYKELESCEDPDFEKGLLKFEKVFLGHVRFLISNSLRSFFHNLTLGAFASSPNKVPSEVRHWYKKLSQASVRFGCMSDIIILLMGTKLKKRQKLGGRMADALSELFIQASILKRYEDDGFPKADYPIIELSLTNSLYRYNTALREAIRNFPIGGIRWLLWALIFPLGSNYKKASDRLGHSVVQLILKPGEVLDRLTRYIYISHDPKDITGRLEVAAEKAASLEQEQKKLDRAERAGRVKHLANNDWIMDAEKLGIITSDESKKLKDLDEAVEFALAVDHFDPKEIPST